MTGGRIGSIVVGVAVLAALAACSPGSSGATRSTTTATGDATATASGTAAGSAELVAAVCAGSAGVTDAGTVTSKDLAELSGIAASRRNPGVWWVHNDSGDSRPVLRGRPTRRSCSSTIDVDGATAVDWEDIAVGPPATEAGAASVYLADIGDNSRNRADITVYRVVEPAVDPLIGLRRRLST